MIDAVKVTESPAHIDVGTAVIVIAGTTIGVIVIWICVLVAVAVDTQEALDVMTTHTESLFANDDGVKVFRLPACRIPFLYHWYVGLLPPFVGVAVKVTDVPAQTVVCAVVTDTAGTTADVMVMIT